MSDTVLYEREGKIATITYNRPESLNAINGQLREDLNKAWETFRNDDEAWIAIVTGSGRAFSVGADIKSFGEILKSDKKVVISIDASELVKGRGGPRCMTLPIKRSII